MFKVVNIVLDRVTIVGQLKRVEKTVVSGGIEIKQEESRFVSMLHGDVDFIGNGGALFRYPVHMKIKEGLDYKSKVYDYYYRLGDHCYIQVKRLAKGNDVRIDFNPAKLMEDETWFLNELLCHVKEKEFTRVDLALDIEGNLSRCRIIDEKKRFTRGYWQGDGILQTLYKGTEYSDSQIKFYDKAKERNKELSKMIRKLEGELKEEVKEECKASNWWRIEETIRGKAVRKWKGHNWFEGIRITKQREFWAYEYKFPEGISPNLKAQVIACKACPELIDEFSRNTRKKIKECMELVSFETVEEFIPEDVLKREKALDVRTIEKALEKYLDLGTVYHEETEDRTVDEEKINRSLESHWEALEKLRSGKKEEVTEEEQKRRDEFVENRMKEDEKERLAKKGISEEKAEDSREPELIELVEPRTLAEYWALSKKERKLLFELRGITSANLQGELFR